MFLLMEYCSGTSNLTRYFFFLFLFLFFLDGSEWVGAERGGGRTEAKSKAIYLPAREAYNIYVWGHARRRINRFHEHPTSTPTH